MRACRAPRSVARVVCSLRDVVPQTAFEDVPPDAYASPGRRRSLGDAFRRRARACRPGGHAARGALRRASELRGAAAIHGLRRPPRRRGPRTRALGRALRRAELRRDRRAPVPARGHGRLPPRRRRRNARTRCACPVFPDPRTAAAVDDARARGDASVRVCGFTSGFGPALAGSALSISRAGYNTSVELLQTGVPAVVVPDPDDVGPAARGRDGWRPSGSRRSSRATRRMPAASPRRSGGRSRRRGRAPASDLNGAATTCALLERLRRRRRGGMALDGFVRVAKHACCDEPAALLDALAALDGDPEAVADALRRHHLIGLVRARIADADLRARLPPALADALASRRPVRTRAGVDAARGIRRRAASARRGRHRPAAC